MVNGSPQTVLSSRRLMKFVVSILLRRRIETRRVLLLNLGLSCIPTHISRYAAPGILVILYSIQAATRNDREGMING